MISFEYRALDNQGNVTDGLRVANNEDSLREYLSNRGLTPVDIEKQNSFWINPFNKPGILARFFRNLSLFLSSGMDLIDALSQVGNRVDNEQVKACVETIVSDIKDGRSFGDALKACEPFFPPAAHRIVTVGEQTGQLNKACEELSEYFQSRDEFVEKVYSMLMYPAIVIGAGILVMFFLMTFVIPRLTALFPENQELPLISKITLGLSSAMQGWSLIVGLVSLVIFFGGIVWLIRQGYGQSILDRWLLRSSIYRRMKAQLFCMSMAMCMSVGMDINQALELGRNVLGNSELESRMQQVRESVRTGHSLTESLRKQNFEMIPLDSVQAGERSGNLERVFTFQAELLQDEINEQLNRLLTMIEPVIVLVLATFVGFIMASIMLPIFQMTSTI